jgi:hypothetical protein
MHALSVAHALALQSESAQSTLPSQSSSRPFEQSSGLGVQGAAQVVGPLHAFEGQAEVVFLPSLQVTSMPAPEQVTESPPQHSVSATSPEHDEAGVPPLQARVPASPQLFVHAVGPQHC